MNFIYSFIRRPKHIFLVHGEEEAQEVLKNKILEEAEIGVTIPEWGETYDLADEIKMTNKIPIPAKPVTLREEVLVRLAQIKKEMQDMENFVKQDVDNQNLREEDIFRINEKIKDLEKQILNVVEG